METLNKNLSHHTPEQLRSLNAFLASVERDKVRSQNNNDSAAPGLIGALLGGIAAIATGSWLKLKHLNKTVQNVWAKETGPVTTGRNGEAIKNYHQVIEDLKKDVAIGIDPLLKRFEAPLDKIKTLQRDIEVGKYNGPELQEMNEKLGKLRNSVIIKRLGLGFTSLQNKTEVFAIAAVTGVALGALAYGISKTFIRDAKQNKESATNAERETARRQAADHPTQSPAL